MGPRPLSLLLLLATLGAADERTESAAAREALLKADFETLAADERDRLFERLFRLDQTEVVRPAAEVISHFGTYIAGLEGKIEKLQADLRKVSDRQGLTDVEIQLRSTWERSLLATEARWREANQSLDLLARLLGGLRHAGAIQAALSIFEKHPTWRARYVLAGACASWHRDLRDEKVSQAMLATLKRLAKDAEPRVRAAVARALASFRREDALELLRIYLKDPDWRVRAAAVKSLKANRSPEAVTLLIEAMRGEDGRLADDIEAALKEMTGESHGFADIWAKWWEDVGRKLPDPSAKKPEAGGGGGAAVAREQDGLRFYGIETRSNRIVFVVDVSGSMLQPVAPLPPGKGPVTGRRVDEDEGPAPGKTRMEVAQNELKRSIQKLGPKAQFTMIFFSHAVMVWKPDLVKATPEAKREAIRAIDELRAAGATYTLGALREAFTIAGAIGGAARTGKDGAKVDTIFLLSDGAPTDSKFDDAKLMDPEIILAAVREWNKDLHVTIHAIAIDLPDNYFLRTLAAENGGKFVERRG